ncbi:MAG: DUF1330 domain-containing protein [Anaerolineales bacterium]
MPAYILVEVHVTDPDHYEGYKTLAAQTIAQYGGRYIVRGGHTETLEGEWSPKRLVILEFPTAEHAKTWLKSPEYAPARAMRHQYAHSQMILAEGVE